MQLYLLSISRGLLCLLVCCIWLHQSALALDPIAWYDTAQLGFDAYNKEKYKEAETHFQKAFEQAKLLGPKEAVLQVRSLMWIASIQDKQGRLEDAASTCKQAMGIATASLKPGDTELVSLPRVYAGILRRLQRSSEAADLDKMADQAEVDNPYAGIARMLPDGTIEMKLVTRSIIKGSLAVSTVLQRYSPAEPGYKELLKHIPGITKDHAVRVPAWKDESKTK